MEILKSVSLLKELLPIIEADQEFYDGSGYPQGLKGEEIPLGARIILIADAFDAMTTDRPYRKALSLNSAIKELKDCSGKDFDPEIIPTAVSLFFTMCQDMRECKNNQIKRREGGKDK